MFNKKDGFIDFKNGTVVKYIPVWNNNNARKKEDQLVIELKYMGWGELINNKNLQASKLAESVSADENISITRDHNKTVFVDNIVSIKNYPFSKDGKCTPEELYEHGSGSLILEIEAIRSNGAELSKFLEKK